MRSPVPTLAIAAALAAESPVIGSVTTTQAPGCYAMHEHSGAGEFVQRPLPAALAGLSLGEAVLALSPFHNAPGVGYHVGHSLAADGAYIRGTYRQNGTRRTANKATGKAQNAAARLSNATSHPLNARASEHFASLGVPFGFRKPR